MGKTIEVRLSDAQHAQLAAEAAASGLPFFGYCRNKLTTSMAAADNLYGCGPMMNDLPRLRSDNERTHHENVEREAALSPTDDRISRIEDAVARLTDFILQGQAAPEQAQAQDPVDVDSIVNAQFNEAEANGLTEHVPDQADIEMQHSGVRSLSRQPMKYSANSAPRHLQQLLG